MAEFMQEMDGILIQKIQAQGLGHRPILFIG